MLRQVTDGCDRREKEVWSGQGAVMSGNVNSEEALCQLSVATL